MFTESLRIIGVALKEYQREVVREHPSGKNGDTLIYLEDHHLVNLGRLLFLMYHSLPPEED